MRCVLVQSQPDQTSTPLGHIVFAFTIIISLIFLITCKHLCSELWIHLCLISFSCSVIDWPQAIIWLYIVFPADVWFFSLSLFLISTVFICVWLNRGWLGVCLCCLFMVCLGLKWCWSWIVVLWQSGSGRAWPAVPLGLPSHQLNLLHDSSSTPCWQTEGQGREFNERRVRRKNFKLRGEDEEAWGIKRTGTRGDRLTVFRCVYI